MIKSGEHLKEFYCEGVRKVVFNKNLNCYLDALPEQIKEEKFNYQFRFSIIHPIHGKAICIVNVTIDIVKESLENRFLLNELRKQYSDLVQRKVSNEWIV